MRPRTVAIDGPAASGKSTLAKKLADEIGYLYFDTGVMYRAITWIVLQRGAELSDESAVTRIAEQVQIDVCPASSEDGRDSDILADGVDITWEIRRPEVDANVSVVAAYPGVRASLTGQQRRIGQRGQVVMVGRDIGTVVLPDADLKVYLDASVEERARRRTEEILSRGEHVDYQAVLETLKKRDQIDSTRDVAPLRVPPGAVVIVSDDLSIEQVLEKTRDLFEHWSPA